MASLLQAAGLCVRPFTKLVQRIRQVNPDHRRGHPHPQTCRERHAVSPLATDLLELADRRYLMLAVGLSGLRAQLVDVLTAIDNVHG